MAAYKNLAKVIVDAIDIGGINHPTTVANAITDYLTKNTSVIVSYSGIISGILPDPVISDTLKISVSGMCAPLVNTDINSYIQSIDLNISASLYLDKGLAGVAPAVLTPAFITGLELTQNDIKNAHIKALDAESTTPNVIIWEEISKKIIEWLEKCNIELSFSAQNTKSGSTGTATIIKTIIS